MRDSELSSLTVLPTSNSFSLKIYLFIHFYDRHRERERGAETQAEGEAGSMQGARRGTRSRNSRIVPWAKGRRETAEPPRDPPNSFSLKGTREKKLLKSELDGNYLKFFLGL